MKKIIFAVAAVLSFSSMAQDIQDSPFFEIIKPVTERVVADLCWKTYRISPQGFMETDCSTVKIMVDDERSNVVIENAKSDNSITNVTNTVEINKIYTLYSIFFDFNSAKIKSSEMKKLDAIIKELPQKNANFKLSVVGFADPVGTDKYNMKLSKKRAEAIVEYLKGNDVNVDSMDARGENDLAVECATQTDKVCNQPNRRVDINIQK